MSFSGTKGGITKPPPGSVEDPFHPLSQGSVCNLLFNEGSGSRVYDISGHGNHGTLVNMPPNAQHSGWGGSKFGGGLHFNIGGEYIDCGNDSSLIPYKLTVSVLVKRRGSVANAGIFSYGANLECGVWEHTGIWDARIKTDGVSPVKIDNFFTPLLDTWYHVVLTWDGNTFTAYVNGEQTGTQPTGSGGILSSGTGWSVGKLNGFNTLRGSIDKFHIYNRALAASEIKQLYHDPFCNLLRVPARRWYSPVVAGIPMFKIDHGLVNHGLVRGGLIS